MDQSQRFDETPHDTPSTELAPAKHAAKLARTVHAMVGEFLDAPDRKGRINKFRRLMDQADAMAGVGPDPAVPEMGEAGSAAFHHALAAFYRRHCRLDAAIEAFAAAAALDPKDMALRGRWLEALWAAGRLHDEAAAVLDVPPAEGKAEKAAAVQFFAAADKMLTASGEHRLALQALERASRLGMSDNLAMRLMDRADAIGDAAQSTAYRAELRAKWTSKLPQSLADGLAALHGLPPLAEPPEAASAWAWALADKQAWSREDWTRARDWGARAGKLVIQWWSVHPERTAEILELIDAPDLEPLRAAQAAGRPQIMASSHSGPSAAAVHFLEASGLPFRTLGGTGQDRVAGEGGTLIPVTNPASASRELVREMRRAGVLAVAADAPAPNDRIELDFLGRRVAIKSLPARLAQKHGCDTWWYQALWRDGRIVFEIERLPDPQPDEPEQEWGERWARAYLKRLKRVMRGDPCNLNLSAGIWRFAEARLA